MTMRPTAEAVPVVAVSAKPSAVSNQPTGEKGSTKPPPSAMMSHVGEIAVVVPDSKNKLAAAPVLVSFANTACTRTFLPDTAATTDWSAVAEARLIQALAHDAGAG